jgi:hypothetical protein
MLCLYPRNNYQTSIFILTCYIFSLIPSRFQRCFIMPFLPFVTSAKQASSEVHHHFCAFNVHSAKQKLYRTVSCRGMSSVPLIKLSFFDEIFSSFSLCSGLLSCFRWYVSLSQRVKLFICVLLTLPLWRTAITVTGPQTWYGSTYAFRKTKAMDLAPLPLGE